MNWGEELWDQYENIASHTNKSIDLLDKYGQFTKELAAIEIDYAAKLRRLSKNYQIKKKDEEDNMCTVVQAFNKSLKEVTDIAGQHEIIAEELSLVIVKEIGTILKELKDERKRHLQEGTKLQNSLQQTITLLEKSKRNYEKAYRESEKAHENYLKADADLNLSRAEVEKARLISTSKNQMCEDAKSDYATHLQRTNKHQREHYTELMPRVFQQLQEMEERRSQCIRNYIQHSAQIRRRIRPIVEKCIDGMLEAAEMIDPKEDSRLVIEKFKSGCEPPSDFPFEDLSNPCLTDSISNGTDSSDSGSVHSSATGTLTNGNNIHNKSGSTLQYSKSVCAADTIKGTVSASKFKKRGGIFGIFGSNKSSFDESKDDFSDLPPNQRRKKLQSKIDLILSNIQQENSVREALLKMRQVYQDNPKLGNAQSVNIQLNENSTTLEKLQSDLKRYESMIKDLLAGTPAAQKKVHSNSFVGTGNSSVSTNTTDNQSSNQNLLSVNHRNSISDNSNDSLSRSESEASVHNHSSSNGSNGSFQGATTGSSLMQAANSLLNKFSLVNNNHTNNSANSNSQTSSTTTTAYLTPPSGSGSMYKLNISGDSGSTIINGKKTNKQSIEYDSSVDDETTKTAVDDEEFDQEIPVIVLGTAKALYPFESNDEGSINMAEGEDFELIELDQGDGWTRVRRLITHEEGFVPTSYIESVLYAETDS